MTNNDLLNTTQKTQDPVTQASLKTCDELMCLGRVGSSCSTSGTRRVTLATNPVTKSPKEKRTGIAHDKRNILS